MPRLLHSPDCFMVSSFCTDSYLGSRVYIGISRFSWYLPPTELEGDIGMTMSACCPSHFWSLCAFADKLMIIGLPRPDKLLLALRPSPAMSWPLIGRVFSAHWDKLMASLPSLYLLLIILRWIRNISTYPVISLSVSALLHIYNYPGWHWTCQMNSFWASIDLIDFLPQSLIHLSD